MCGINVDKRLDRRVHARRECLDLLAAAMLSCNAVVKDEQAASERPVPCGALSVMLRILAAVECASLAALCASAVSTTRFILRGYSGVFDLSMV